MFQNMARSKEKLWNIFLNSGSSRYSRKISSSPSLPPPSLRVSTQSRGPLPKSTSSPQYTEKQMTRASSVYKLIDGSHPDVSTSTAWRLSCNARRRPTTLLASSAVRTTVIPARESRDAPSHAAVSVIRSIPVAWTTDGARAGHSARKLHQSQSFEGLAWKTPPAGPPGTPRIETISQMSPRVSSNKRRASLRSSAEMPPALSLPWLPKKSLRYRKRSTEKSSPRAPPRPCCSFRSSAESCISCQSSALAGPSAIL
mmetsp:Transcript_134743/g.300279  ORF Transcript_134743/g.300279 Transcript_134743/m.300279 type:complete len:256 (+) Transcript_134743:1636-2403(+)